MVTTVFSESFILLFCMLLGPQDNSKFMVTVVHDNGPGETLIVTKTADGRDVASYRDPATTIATIRPVKGKPNVYDFDAQGKIEQIDLSEAAGKLIPPADGQTAELKLKGGTATISRRGNTWFLNFEGHGKTYVLNTDAAAMPAAAKLFKEDETASSRQPVQIAAVPPVNAGPAGQPSPPRTVAPQPAVVPVPVPPVAPSPEGSPVPAVPPGFTVLGQTETCARHCAGHCQTLSHAPSPDRLGHGHGAGRFPQGPAARKRHESDRVGRFGRERKDSNLRGHQGRDCRVIHEKRRRRQRHAGNSRFGGCKIRRDKKGVAEPQSPDAGP